MFGNCRRTKSSFKNRFGERFKIDDRFTQETRIRMAYRVARGGLNVEEPVVRRRYRAGLINLWQEYRPRLDRWFLFDNSGANQRVIAREQSGTSRSSFMGCSLKRLRDAVLSEHKMKVADLKKMRGRAPFRAFQLHLTSGETLPVRHPEYIAIPPEAETELFVVWVGPDWNLVDAAQVARVSLLNSKNRK